MFTVNFNMSHKHDTNDQSYCTFNFLAIPQRLRTRTRCRRLLFTHRSSARMAVRLRRAATEGTGGKQGIGGIGVAVEAVLLPSNVRESDGQFSEPSWDSVCSWVTVEVLEHDVELLKARLAVGARNWLTMWSGGGDIDEEVQKPQYLSICAERNM